MSQNIGADPAFVADAIEPLRVSTEGFNPGEEALPTTMPGHWDTPEGCRKAHECLRERREDLAKGHLSDMVVANAIFLVGRDDPALIHWQQAAKERIRWLSAQLAAAHVALGKVGGAS